MPKSDAYFSDVEGGRSSFGKLKLCKLKPWLIINLACTCTCTVQLQNEEINAQVS
jgi:hypothetical protein